MASGCGDPGQAVKKSSGIRTGGLLGFGRPEGIPGGKGCRVWANVGVETCKVCLT